MDINLKRIYEEPSKSDGTRILVDRIWPRGIKKENARLDDWIQEIAPSTELRKWFDHKDDRFPLFREKYKRELDTQQELIKILLTHAKQSKLTLLYGAKNTEHNQAIV